MNQPKDSCRMIDADTSAALFKKTLGPSSCISLKKKYDTYLDQEPLCADAINKLVAIYSTIVLNGAIQSFGDDQEIDMADAAEFGDQTAELIKMAFAAGMLYGSAKSDVDFISVMKGAMDENPIDDLQGMVNDEGVDFDDLKPFTLDDLDPDEGEALG